MARLTIKTKDEENRLYIEGDVSVVLASRRAMRLLRDAFEILQTQPRIEIGIRTDFSRTIDLVRKVAEIAKCECTLAGDAQSSMDAYQIEERKFQQFSSRALHIRNNECDFEEFNAFKTSVETHLRNRNLYPLQMLSAYHLAYSQNACNFSVPGAGKTSVVYGAYAHLHNLPEGDPKHIDRILIVSPLNAFGPWETEFEECFGRKPTSTRLTGNVPIDVKKQYLYTFDPSEITLLSYASVISLRSELKHYLSSHRVMVVLDEAHKIKNTNGGVISEAILSLAQYASARVVLTGTPAPNGYEDILNLFKFIWPTKNVIRYNAGQLRDMSRNRDDPRVQGLLESINPYFLRIRKSDLHIPPATENPPIVVDMDDAQRRLYDYIEQRYMGEIADRAGSTFFSEIAQAKLIRLMQASTNPGLLAIPLRSILEREGIDPNKVADDSNFLGEVLKFSSFGVPSKFIKMLELVRDIVGRGEKVVVWASFIANIEYAQKFLQQNGIESRALYGGTPVAGNEVDEEDPAYALTREAIVREFNRADCPYQVVVANPFAVAESISLHKACHNAIYLERTFNAAHFLQSKDRIHRYGLSSDVKTNYYYIISRNSIDETIHQRLLIKERRLLQIIESMPIPLFDNVIDGVGDEDIKALLKDYASRSKTV